MAETTPAARDLPRLMLITQRQSMVPFAQVLEAALEDGARLIQLREKGLAQLSLLELALRAGDLCERFGARLIVNGSVHIAREAGAAGVHFSMHRTQQPALQAAARCGLLIGAAVHSAEEARQAQVFGADYLVLGSIFATASHPEATPLGLQVLAEVAREVRIPVFAVGGITSQNARGCLEAGAHGVAAIRAAWNPEERRELLRVVGEF